MLLFLLLFALLLLYYLWESLNNQRCLNSFQAVIHVSGIRGKTSVCRLIDAALRKRYTVLTKTTGTDAVILHPDGRTSPVRRLGPANIHEQIGMIRRARKEGAQILVLECMAVNPELQKISQEQIVKAPICVITNVRYDHTFEMGDTLEEIAQSLSAVIPTNGTLYTADAAFAGYFKSICQKKGSRLVLCPSDRPSEENIGIARAVSRSLGVTEEEFQESLEDVTEDFGCRRIYKLRNKDGAPIWFLNLFSANDPTSAISNTDELRENYHGLYFLYNHRGDRPDRALLFARYFFPHYRAHTVFLIGSGLALPKRLFKDAVPGEIRPVKHYRQVLEQIPPNSLLVGIGSIKGAGYSMIQDLETGESDV